MDSENFRYELKVPRDRIAVIIGVKGKDKKELEESTNTKINIDSKEGDIVISGEDALGLYTAREIIRAISRGFNPEIAKLLLNEDYVLEIIDINNLVGKNKSQLLRIKGRVIGTKGKSRRVIEDLTGTYISVYGKTISIIGYPDAADAARRAIESLLRGAKHGNVYKVLEKRKSKIKRNLI